MMAELILRQDARKELCRECGEEGKESGVYEIKDQHDRQNNPMMDEAGNQLRIKFPQYICSNTHTWWKGEGRAKSTHGKNHILFPEHEIIRKKREIYAEAGIVDDSIVSGSFNKAHPQGRQINSKEARDRGSSFYKS
jgi:hypothetical protein